jgi:predicted ATPase
VAGERQPRDLVRGLKLLLGTVDPDTARDPSGAAGEALLAARAVVEGLAREGPVLAVVDDVHWADAQLRELGELALGPGAPAQLLDRIAARASGNPLFLEESLSILVESGALLQRAGARVVTDPRLLDRVPASIRSLIAARLDGLPPDEKHVLRDAAVYGEVTWDRLLEDVSAAADVRSALGRLVQRDVLRRRPRSRVPGAVEYTFRHVLLREVAAQPHPRHRDRRPGAGLAGRRHRRRAPPGPSAAHPRAHRVRRGR